MNLPNMPINLTIDALPILAGKGGISNYVMPLIQHFCKLNPSGIETTLHWRLQSASRRRRYAELQAAGFTDYPGVRHHVTYIPDRLLGMAWKTSVPGLSNLGLPPTDIYLATTELMPIKAKCRRISIIHDIMPAVIPKYFTVDKDKYLAKITEHCKLCNKIICVSEKTAQDLVSIIGINPANTEVIYTGLPVPCKPTLIGDHGVLEKWGIKPPFILYLGNLAKHKNVDGLIRVFIDFNKTQFGQKWQLVLAGKDILGSEYWNDIIGSDRNLQSQIIITGWIEDEERWALLRKAEILMHLSWYEGFGLPLIEAAAVGLPALVSNCSVFPEVIPNPDQLVDPADTAEVVKKLCAFAEDPELGRKWSAFMCKRAGEMDWQKSATMLEKLINQIS